MKNDHKGVLRMIRKVVVMGAGVGGLGVAIGLARQGCNVTVVERDPAPDAQDGESAFATWQRPSVPQARQPHGFWARTRNLLIEHAPDVVADLVACGVQELNFLDMAPPEFREPDDVQFTGLLVRRLPFELALRRAAESRASIEVRSGVVVEGLVFADGDGPPKVTGVRLRSGEVLHADLVVDAGGRKSRVVEWLAQRGVSVPTTSEDCNIVYQGRHFRQRPDSTMDRTALTMGLSDLGYMMFATFDGDNRSYSLFLATPPWDKGLQPLRHNHVWEAVARSIPRLAPWTDPAHAEPITDVQTMAGHRNVLRQFVVDGAPVVLGLLAVGDALCTTNPNQGWGASLALTYAFAAADAVRDHGNGLHGLAVAYHGVVAPVAEAYYRESAVQDRLRTYAWRNEAVPADELEDRDRQSLLQNGLQPAMRRDMHVLRAMLRRLHLIDAPAAIWSDEQALAAAREVAAWRAANRPPSSLGPDREAMLRIIAEARQQDAVPAPRSQERDC